LSRWDIETQQETILEPITERFFNVIPSPDDRWLLRLANTLNIEVRPVSGGAWTQIASVRLPSPVVSEIAFAPDSGSVIYLDQNPSGKPGLFRIPTAGGTPERLADLPPSAEVRQILAGGRRVVMVSSDMIAETWILENYVPKAAR
jgi:hypothetical protein